MGWPTFDSEGYYTGPLRACAYRHMATLVGPEGEAKRVLADTSSYTKDMNHWLAKSFCEARAAARHVAALRAEGRLGHAASGDINRPPTRGPPIGDAPLEPDDEYIGRGGHGQAPSKWGNPWKVTSGYPAVAAVEDYEAWIRGGGGPAHQLRCLGGKWLRCHCRLCMLCHADALIRSHAAAVAQGGHAQGRLAQEWLGAEGPPARRAPAGGQHAPPDVAGDPILVSHKGRLRGLVDGAGLCSPGRWHPKQRELGDTVAAARVRELVQDAVRGWQAREDEATGTGHGLRTAVFELAAEKRKDRLAPEDIVAKLRRELAGLAAQHWLGPDTREGDVKQTLHVRLLAAVASVLEDPDSSFPAEVARGVRLGVGVTMPRTPAVFEAKTKWALPHEDEGEGGSEKWATNYASAHERPETVRAQFENEVMEGLMIKVTAAEAKRRWPGRLAVAALGAIQKAAGKDDWRVIFDATHDVRVNHQIRVRDQVRCPTWGDVGNMSWRSLGASARSGSASCTTWSAPTGWCQSTSAIGATWRAGCRTAAAPMARRTRKCST